MGQRIRLEHDEYFDEGYRDSRITKITRKVLRPTDMDIEISDVVSTGSLSKLTSDISSIKAEVKQAAASALGVIKTGDSTKFTDNNTLSALRATKEFISRLNNDTVKGILTLLKGLLLADGTSITSEGYTTGALGSGLAIKVDENGDSYIEVDRALFRKSATFM
ncbi:MAG: hypothetical protein SNH18_10575 [Rikenellaceae bacterium]